MLVSTWSWRTAASIVRISVVVVISVVYVRKNVLRSSWKCSLRVFHRDINISLIAATTFARSEVRVNASDHDLVSCSLTPSQGRPWAIPHAPYIGRHPTCCYCSVLPGCHFEWHRSPQIFGMRFLLPWAIYSYTVCVLDKNAFSIVLVTFFDVQGTSVLAMTKITAMLSHNGPFTTLGASASCATGTVDESLCSAACFAMLLIFKRNSTSGKYDAPATRP